MRKKSKSTNNPDQMSLFSTQPYEVVRTQYDIDVVGYEPPPPKSTPVASKTVQRVYFWVETYLMRGRYLHYRFCHIRCGDGISRVVKIHIPGRGMSVRKGRAQLVRDAIASNKSPGEIEQLIRGWRA